VLIRFRHRRLKRGEKGVIQVAEGDKKAIIRMAILAVTRDNVLAGVNKLGIPEEQVTDDVIELVKRKVIQNLGDWREIVREMVKDTIRKGSVRCPLGLVCSRSCTRQGV